MWNAFWDGRGVPWEFDAGPPASSDYAELFAQTPNYRGVGQAILGSEGFRWHHGPVFYRGRLGQNQVRVLVIGQEGGQDEALAHRAFVGGSGARMQHLLKFLGITQSYLFLNTFFYPIFGQYGTKLRWLAQSPDSPIVKHRHAVFEHVVARNPALDLIIAVGAAARETVDTWFDMRGAPPHADSLRVNVVHPGAASGGSATAVLQSFRAAVTAVRNWANTRPAWLPVDPGATRDLTATFTYLAAPIPFRDLPYGAPWRIGYGGTTSNRRDDQRGIQIFSTAGKYNNQGHDLIYSSAATGSAAGYSAHADDLAYEPPRHDADFDRGPPSAAWARLLMGGEPNLDWPDFQAFGLPCHPSFGFGPIYRGRPGQASVIVLADRDTHDDLLTARALTGEDGQRLQGFLRAAGLTKKYLILRVLPVNTQGAAAATLRSVVDHASIRALYREALNRCQTAKVLIAMGTLAQRLVSHVNARNLPVVQMKKWSQSGAATDWARAHLELVAHNYPTDVAPSATFDGQRSQVARIDLPYATLRWKGSSGNRVVQPRRGSNPSPDYFKIMIPRWVNDLDPRPLTTAEQQAVDLAP
jgi:uracil-DNA glycosylase